MSIRTRCGRPTAGRLCSAAVLGLGACLFVCACLLVANRTPYYIDNKRFVCLLVLMIKQMCVYIYIYICTHTHTCVYIYIERERCVCVCV